MTKKAEVLAFVKKAKKTPTIAQVAKACKVTPLTARRYLYYLQKEKKISKTSWDTGAKKTKKKTTKAKPARKTTKRKITKRKTTKRKITKRKTARKPVRKTKKK